MAAMAKTESKAVRARPLKTAPSKTKLELAKASVAKAPLAKAARAAPAPVKKKATATHKKAPASHAKAGDLQIGGRLKHARLLAGVRMRELASRVGCTEGMVSKIENGHVVPSLPMLQRLVEALDRDLTSFFGSNPSSPGIIQRAGERPVASTDPIRDGRRVSYERLVPFGAGHLLEGNIHVIQANGLKHDPITHQGETLGYVIEGQLELTIETTQYQLNAGDSFFFKNHLTNSYRNLGPGEARVLWVNTPQIH
jgi:transcriptional regulator with XRE-family HTH domain